MTHHCADIKRSWDANAQVWIRAVRQKIISSRKIGTDRFIVEAIKRLNPKSVIDIGCGEGWLVRQLSDDSSCQVTGIDGCEQLIKNAQSAHPRGHYSVQDYDHLALHPETLEGPYDVAVCNFALLDKNLVPLLSAIRHNLNSNGSLLIQTLHPSSSNSDDDTRDGWRSEDFSALGSDPWQEMPWYFRTLTSWKHTLASAGFSTTASDGPGDPKTEKPLSILFHCVVGERLATKPSSAKADP
jgi:2-polyprenyl-3-methyl-5-hydroxy-6-metoxy-1,4-benzoquinol methylase